MIHLNKLEKKKIILTDVEEIKVVNKQINTLQEELPYNFAITFNICSPKPIV